MLSDREPCKNCGGSLEGKRPHAVYCSRICKGRAGSKRRTLSGEGKRRDRARYPKEAEYRRAQAREYSRNNPLKNQARRNRRRAATRGADALLDGRDWEKLVNRHLGLCAYCGLEPEKIHMDHVQPIAKGGRHVIGNVLPACPTCNKRKRDHLLADVRYRKGVRRYPFYRSSETWTRECA